MKKYMVTLFLLGPLMLPEPLWAAEYYGSLQISDPLSGVTQIVFQSADSKKLCKALNENFWRGLRTSCPQCRRESSSCDTTLPSAYRDIFSDKPLVLPYVSAPYTRIVILGVPLQQTTSMCREMARQWKQGMNQQAKCITR